MLLFFFFKQKTAYEMRISDWSSDVCSSDLFPELVIPQWRFREMSPLIDSANMTPAYWQQLREAVVDAVDVQGCDSVLILHGTDTLAYSAAEIGRASCRARVCPYV